MSTLKEALDLYREIQIIEEPVARAILMDLWVREHSTVACPPEQDVQISLGAVEVPAGPQPTNHFPSRTKPAKRTLTAGSKLDRTLHALQAFPEGVILADLQDMVDEDLKPNLSSSLNYLAKHGFVRRHQVVTTDRNTAVREMWKYFPKTESDGKPGGGPRR